MNRIYLNLPYTLVMILILIIGASYLFSPYMDQYPAFVHSWTQSDRLAIAMNFQENGFDFFHPATYNLLTKDGVTQVDFPIHDYLVALFSSLFKTSIVSTFRFYNLLYALIGLFFLYRASLRSNGSAAKSVLFTALMASLPFFAYYQNGFLPSVPSFANFCIGVYFLIKYCQTSKNRSYITAVIFFTLAALARIPFTIFLLAVLLERAYTSWKSSSFNLKELISPLIGLILVILYYLYNQSLAEEYGSMFLSKFRYPSTLEEFTSIFTTATERWSGHFLSPYHWVMVVLLVIALYKQRGGNMRDLDHEELLSRQVIFALPFVLLYFFLLGLQFVDHDYYYIDSFLPLLTLAFLWALSKVEVSQKWYTAIASASIILLIGAYSHASEVLVERYSVTSNPINHYNYRVFKRAKSELKNWNIQEEDTLAFFDIGSTNIPFTIFKNKGYTSLSSGRESCELLLKEEFDYAFIIDSTKVSDSYFDFPGIAYQLDYIDGNGEISFYKKSNSDNASQFFRELHYIYKNNFDRKMNDSLTNIAAGIDYQNDSVGNVLNVTEANEFFLTSSVRVDDQMAGKDVRVAINFDLHPLDSINGVQIILSLPSYYFAYFLESEFKELNEWQNKTFIKRIPSKYLRAGEELKVYFWNPSQKKLELDNYHLLIYQ